MIKYLFSQIIIFFKQILSLFQFFSNLNFSSIYIQYKNITDSYLTYFILFILCQFYLAFDHKTASKYFTWYIDQRQTNIRWVKQVRVIQGVSQKRPPKTFEHIIKSWWSFLKYFLPVLIFVHSNLSPRVIKKFVSIS